MNALFQVHKLNDQGMEKAKKLAEMFDALLSGVESLNRNQGRELALAKTHLELASFYAKKAMAMNPENQETGNVG